MFLQLDLRSSMGLQSILLRLLLPLLPLLPLLHLHRIRRDHKMGQIKTRTHPLLSRHNNYKMEVIKIHRGISLRLIIAKPLTILHHSIIFL
jgi:hypothetical protein